jgi:hypothetical protein
MSISVQHEDAEALKKWGIGLEEAMERCVFCKNGTPFWHLPTNNPVCENCACTHEESELPARSKLLETQ